MSFPREDEVQRLRIVANATPVTHNVLGQIPNKGTIPLPQTKTGTISSDPTTADPGNIGNKKVVFGSGTQFTVDVQPGDYIYAADVVRKVEWVTNDTQLILRDPFPSVVSAAALKVVRSGKYKIILAENTGSVTAKLHEADLKAGQRTAMQNDQGLTPISYDVSGAGAEITFDVSE